MKRGEKTIRSIYLLETPTIISENSFHFPLNSGIQKYIRFLKGLLSFRVANWIINFWGPNIQSCTTMHGLKAPFPILLNCPAKYNVHWVTVFLTQSFSFFKITACKQLNLCYICWTYKLLSWFLRWQHL